MAVITVPNQSFREISGAPSIKAKGQWRSPFTFSEQTFVWPGESFQFGITLPPMTHAEASPWIDFLGQAEASDDIFYLNLSTRLPVRVTDRANVPCKIVPMSFQQTQTRDGMYSISFSIKRAQ